MVWSNGLTTMHRCSTVAGCRRRQIPATPQIFALGLQLVRNREPREHPPPTTGLRRGSTHEHQSTEARVGETLSPRAQILRRWWLTGEEAWVYQGRKYPRLGLYLGSIPSPTD